MALTERYFLNGKDMFLNYGFVPSNGSMDSLMERNEPKERYSHDWPEENGKEYDLINPVKLKERQFNIIGTIKADNYADYTAKMDALETELYSGVCEIEAVIGNINTFTNNTTLFAYKCSVYRNALTAPNGFCIEDGASDGYARVENVINSNGLWSISFTAIANGTYPLTVDACDVSPQVFNLLNGVPVKCQMTVDVQNFGGVYNFIDFENTAFGYTRIIDLKIEKGAVATDFQPELKANTILQSIKVDKLTKSTATPFYMPIEIKLTEVFV